MSAATVVMEYASTESGTTLNPRCAAMARPMLVTAIFSGLSVGVCFLVLMGHPMMVAVHLFVFVVTIVYAIKAGRAMHIPGETPGWREVLDASALLGLIGIAIAPLVYQASMHIDFGGTEVMLRPAGFVLGGCYLLLAISTMRHVAFHNQVADWLRQTNRHALARSFVALGWVKLLYEAAWLSCCASTLVLLAIGKTSVADAPEIAIFFAFGALFGAIGFTAIWIWMIVSHALLFRITARRIHSFAIPNRVE